MGAANSSVLARGVSGASFGGLGILDGRVDGAGEGAVYLEEGAGWREEGFGLAVFCGGLEEGVVVERRGSTGVFFAGAASMDGGLG